VLIPIDCVRFDEIHLLGGGPSFTWRRLRSSIPPIVRRKQFRALGGELKNPAGEFLPRVVRFSVAIVTE